MDFRVCLPLFMFRSGGPNLSEWESYALVVSVDVEERTADLVVALS